MLSAAVAGLAYPCTLVAQTTTPPTVVPQDRDDRDLLKDLQGVPDNIKTLILNFDQTADQFLAQQRQLLYKLHHATTSEEREKIREQLQDNRQAFLAELKAFREQLKDDLAALKGKITLGEFRRILDAAKDAVGDSVHHHRGH
jgi:ribosomal protein L16 Arg81 hydroxylase